MLSWHLSRPPWTVWWLLVSKTLYMYEYLSLNQWRQPLILKSCYTHLLVPFPTCLSVCVSSIETGKRCFHLLRKSSISQKCVNFIRKMDYALQKSAENTVTQWNKVQIAFDVHSSSERIAMDVGILFFSDRRFCWWFESIRYFSYIFIPSANLPLASSICCHISIIDLTLRYSLESVQRWCIPSCSQANRCTSSVLLNNPSSCATQDK